MLEQVKALIATTDIFEFLDLLEKLFSQEYSNKEMSQIKARIKREYNKFVKNYQIKYFKYKNIILYPEDKPILILGYYLTLTNDLTKSIDLFLNKYKDNFTNKKSEQISLKEELEILNLAQAKYHYLDIVQKSQKTFHIFHFPYISKYSTNFLHYIKTTKGYSYYYELYGSISGPLILNKYSTFAFGLGRFLNWIIMLDPEEAPYGFERLLKRENVNLLIQEKSNLTEVFGDIFAGLLLKNTKYRDSILEIKSPAFEQYLQEQLNLYLELYEEDIEAIEIDDDEICPCGSKKKYVECCKQKEIKWKRDKASIIKEIKAEKLPMQLIQDYYDKKNQLWNRYLYGSERIFSEMTLLDTSFSKHIKELRKLGFPEDELYAMYKTNRVITKFNASKVPDIEIQEWEEAKKEYQDIISHDSDESLSMITGIKIINGILEELWNEFSDLCLSSLNMFIAFYEPKYNNYSNFNIKTIEDFLIFCTRKAFINFETIIRLIASNDYDASMAIIRNLYEILVNIKVYQNDPSLFNQKVIPLANVDNINYSYIKNKDGFTSKYKILNNKTGEIINTQITIAELSKKAGVLYENLYNNLFNELSIYIHLNVSSSARFFQELDPFYELDPINISSLLSLFIVTEIISLLANVDSISNLLYRDLTYISNKIKGHLTHVIPILKNLANDNIIYKILYDMVKDYNII